MNLQNFEMEIRKRARRENGSFSPMPMVGGCHLEDDVVVASSCKPEKISSILNSLHPHKADILKSIGFDGLHRIPLLENLNDHLSLWLYQRFDLVKMCLHLDDGVDLYLRDADVFLIFGIPFHGRPVNFGLNQSFETVSAFYHKLSIATSNSVVNMSVLEEIVTKDYGPTMSDEDIDAFIIASVLISMHYLLAPEQKPNFPKHLIKNFVPDVIPNQINWAQYVLWTIGRSAFDTRLQISNGSKRISMFGCTHLLQVFYLDNLNFGPCSPFHIVLPRASAYSSEVLKNLIVSASSGQSNDKLMLFGSTQVRPASDVCYTRGWQQHLEMQTELQNISQDDYLTSIGMIIQAIELIDKFAATQYGFNDSTLVTPMESLLLLQSSYLNFKSAVNDNIPSLFSKAALVVKNRIVGSHPQHIPEHVHTSSSKLLPTGPMQDLACPDFDGQSSSSKSNNSGKMVKVVTTHSNFDSCPFGTNFKHQDVTFTSKARCFLWLSNPCLRTDQLNQNYIVFESPKELLITGDVLRNCLKGNGIFDINIVDAIMNVWNYLDGKLYKEINRRNRWRHFLPASFAEIVNQNCDFLNCAATRASFIGQHFNYNVEDCQKIIIPVSDNKKSWSTYIWDFKHKTITVLDPLFMQSSQTRVKVKHHRTVLKMHDALLACTEKFFCGWHIDRHGWIDHYVTDVGGKSKIQNTGLYAVQYARAFCGGNLILPLMEESTVSQGRGEILYYLLKCEDNKGYKPQSLMQDI